MDLNDILKESIFEVIKEVVSEKEEKGKVPIGNISPSLLQKYVDWQNEKEDIETEMKIQLEKMQRRLKREFAEKYEENYEEICSKRETLWNEIFKEMKIDDNGERYNLNTKTGVVSQYVKTAKK
jgi:hypothetical protein